MSGPAVVYPTPNFIRLHSGSEVHIWLAGTTIYTGKLTRHIKCCWQGTRQPVSEHSPVFSGPFGFAGATGFGSPSRPDDKGHRRVTGRADGDRADHRWMAWDELEVGDAGSGDPPAW